MTEGVWHYIICILIGRMFLPNGWEKSRVKIDHPHSPLMLILLILSRVPSQEKKELSQENSKLNEQVSSLHEQLTVLQTEVSSLMLERNELNERLSKSNVSSTQVSELNS